MMRAAGGSTPWRAHRSSSMWYPAERLTISTATNLDDAMAVQRVKADCLGV
jgi:hypothetical protein